MSNPPDQRPVIVALAGPNGAGKTTFYHAHLRPAALRFVNTEEKLTARYPRTLANLQTAIRELAHVWIFDNDDLRTPFRQVAVFQNGQCASLNKPVPRWLRPLLLHGGSTAGA